MKKNKILTVLCLCIFSIIFLVSIKTKAFQITDNQIVDSNKEWTIKFTGEVGFDDVTKQGIIVTDNSGNKIDTSLELSNDNKSIIVDSPVNGYFPGKNYTLTVKKQCHSSSGVQMKQDRIIHFSIKK